MNLDKRDQEEQVTGNRQGLCKQEGPMRNVASEGYRSALRLLVDQQGYDETFDLTMLVTRGEVNGQGHNMFHCDCW